MAYLFLLCRILFGGFFIMNGYGHLKGLSGLTSYASSKKIPSPKAAVTLSGIMMLVGGAGVVLGIMPRLAILLIILCMLPITFMMHNYWKEHDSHARMMQKIQFDKNIAIIAGAIAFLFITTPWIFSI